MVLIILNVHGRGNAPGASCMCRLSQDNTAMFLSIMPTDLAQYECGITKIPFDVLEYLFVMGYKMLQVRTTETRYRKQRKIFNKIKNTVSEIS